MVGGISLVTVRNVMEARQAEAEQAALPPPKQVQVAALGRIEPASRVIDVAASENGRIGELVVREGEQVEKGQTLAYMDTYGVRKAERDVAASQLAEAQAQLQAQRELSDSQIAEATTRIEQVNNPKQATIAAQDAAIASLGAQLQIAEDDLSRLKTLFESGAISEQDLNRQQARVDQLRAERANAEAIKSRIEDEWQSNMNNAQAQLASAQASKQLAEIESRVRSATQNLALAESRLALTIIKAPVAGQVLKIYTDPGEASSPEGEPILSLGDTRQMYIVAEVYETDIRLVKPGQKVTITSRNGAFDETLTGTVEEVGLQIYKNDILDDDPAANADARVVEVRIRVDQSEAIAGLTNLQVDVAIDIEDTTARAIGE